MKIKQSIKAICFGTIIAAGAFLVSCTEETTQQVGISIASDCNEGICGFVATPVLQTIKNGKITKETNISGIADLTTQWDLGGGTPSSQSAMGDLHHQVH